MKPDAIKDKVAIIGMGCTHFKENWDKSADDMIIDATYEAYEDAGIGPKDIEAGWCGSIGSAFTGGSLTVPLKLRNLPISHVENACASGKDALRNAAHAVACGLYDIVLVVGIEKLKDTGFSGLPEYFAHPVYGQGATAPGRWALGATGYFSTYGLSREEGKATLAKLQLRIIIMVRYALKLIFNGL